MSRSSAEKRRINNINKAIMNRERVVALVEYFGSIDAVYAQLDKEKIKFNYVNKNLTNLKIPSRLASMLNKNNEVIAVFGQDYFN